MAFRSALHDPGGMAPRRERRACEPRAWWGGAERPAGRGADESPRPVTTRAHQRAYWTTVWPNPALCMGKMVGLSVSKLKQREEAMPGEEGAERSFAKVLPLLHLPGPDPHAPRWAQRPVPPGLLASQAWASPASLLSFRRPRDRASPSGRLASFNSLFRPNYTPHPKGAPSPPPPWGLLSGGIQEKLGPKGHCGQSTQ